MSDLLYALFHTLARGFAAAAVTMFFQGKAEAFGARFEGAEAVTLSLVLLAVALALALGESLAEKRKQGG